MQIVLMIIMAVVKMIRKDNYHYLSVPDEIISWVKSDRIMKFGHFFPSVIVTILLTVKLFPLISAEYAEHLEENGNIILITFVIVFITVLIINGIIVESILEKTNSEYKNFKKYN